MLLRSCSVPPALASRAARAPLDPCMRAHPPEVEHVARHLPRRFTIPAGPDRNMRPVHSAHHSYMTSRVISVEVRISSASRMGRRCRNVRPRTVDSRGRRQDRELVDQKAVDVAVGAESLEGPGRIGLHGHADRARHVARLPSRMLARFAPSVLSANSMLRRSLATFWNSRSVGELSMGTSGSSRSRNSASPCRR